MIQYNKEQRLEIGRQLYYEELTRAQAAEKYQICEGSARDYMRLYRDENNLPAKKPMNANKSDTMEHIPQETDTLKSYESMTKEELIQELVKARITEARLKKNYEVMEDGTVIHYSRKNTR